ncbi:MAG: hypothetical protein FWC21_04915 [Treponema sp.]|nr:hypothetical protein [Treponema sp.]
MRKIVSLMGITAIAIVIGLSVTSCAALSGTKAAERTSVPAAEPGFILITGLEDYNDYYVYAAGLDGETYALAAMDIMDNMGEDLITGIIIKNGAVLLPVWEIFREYDDDLSGVVFKKTPYKKSISGIFTFVIWDGGEILNRFSEIYYYGDIYISSSQAEFIMESFDSGER